MIKILEGIIFAFAIFRLGLPIMAFVDAFRTSISSRLRRLKLYMSKIKLYNPLGLICGCMIFVSELFPWWSMTIIGYLYKIKYVLNAYPYVLSIPENFPREWMPGVIVTHPVATVVLMLALAAFISSCFLSSFLRGRKCKLLLGAVGVSFLLFVIGFFGSIYYACIIRTDMKPPVPIQGSAFVSFVGDVTAGFQPAFYLAIVAGLLCIISAIFHEKFVFKS